MIKAKNLKHLGLIKKATEYDVTGQPSGWVTDFSLYVGIDTEQVSKDNTADNKASKKSLFLFSYFDDRLQNGQTLLLKGVYYKISELDNVELADRRHNFVATEL